MRYLIGLIVIALAAACFAVALFIAPSQAQEDKCFTVAEAQAIMAEHDLEVIGVLPFLKGTAVYYRETRGVFAAPIIDGCVSPLGFFVPGYVEPSPVTAV